VEVKCEWERYAIAREDPHSGSEDRHILISQVICKLHNRIDCTVDILVAMTLLALHRRRDCAKEGTAERKALRCAEPEGIAQ
jgi:hypothetical protein